VPQANKCTTKILYGRSATGLPHVNKLKYKHVAGYKNHEKHIPATG